MFLTRCRISMDQRGPTGYSLQGGAVGGGCSGLGQYYTVTQYITPFKSLHPVSTAPPFAECRQTTNDNNDNDNDTDYDNSNADNDNDEHNTNANTKTNTNNQPT